MNYATKEIEQVRFKLNAYDTEYGKGSYIIAARQDIAYIIKFVLQYDNILFNQHKIYTETEFLDYAYKINKPPVFFDNSILPIDPQIKSGFGSWFLAQSK